MTKQESAIITAYTGILIGPFSAFHEYAEILLDRPIFTHQFPDLMEEIKDKSKEDFFNLMESIER